MRHELRTFANHILGYSDMLLEGARDDGIDTLVPGLEEIHRLGEVVVGRNIGVTLAPTRTDVTVKDYCSLADQLQPRIDVLQKQTNALVSERTEEQGLAGEKSDLGKIRTAIQNLRDFVAAHLLEGTAVRSSWSRAFVGLPAVRLLVSADDEHDGTEQPGQGHILIVDDVENNREMLRRRLQRQGYTVVEASNGREAFDRGDPAGRPGSGIAGYSHAGSGRLRGLAAGQGDAGGAGSCRSS